MKALAWRQRTIVLGWLVVGALIAAAYLLGFTGTSTERQSPRAPTGTSTTPLR